MLALLLFSLFFMSIAQASKAPQEKTAIELLNCSLPVAATPIAKPALANNFNVSIYDQAGNTGKTSKELSLHQTAAYQAPKKVAKMSTQEYEAGLIKAFNALDKPAALGFVKGIAPSRYNYFLYWSVHEKIPHVTRWLLEQGADCCAIQSVEGKSALDCAMISMQDDMIGLCFPFIVKKTAALSKLLFYACKNGKETLLHMILDTKLVHANSRDAHNKTPLWHAYHEGFFSLAPLLKKHGADKRDEAITPLYTAKKSNQVVWSFRIKETNKGTQTIFDILRTS